MTTTTTPIDVSTQCPECETAGAWHGVAGEQGVYSCDLCGHTEDYACPSWCERTDHHGDVVDEEHPPLHYSPDFGSFGLQAVGGAPFQLSVLEIPTGGPASAIVRRLHQLAADALAAAAWLDEEVEHENLTIATVERAAVKVGVEAPDLLRAIMGSRECNR